jgi:Zn-dependent protease with chaperone function
MTTSDVRSKIPPGPEHVPPALAAPTRAFKMHAWLATVAFVAFVAVYLGLTFWLGAMIFRFLRDGLRENFFIGLLQSAIPALLLFVLVRGIFAIKRGTDPKDLIEVRPDAEPDLFAFLHDIADKVGAPRPHKVYLAPEVNAAVFYDLGFINFIFPTKKNLLIGVGLLNVLTLSELRAVLAHEFGHFAQRTVAIGSWVYLAEQIASYIVSSRSKLDNALRTLSVQDPRIAWIGWILRVCVWAVRAVLDTMYLIVALSKRALSREMELQADLVAVSLTGSDALVHALHKTGSADQSMASAMSTLRRELAAGSRVPDLYALQQRFTENFRRVTDDPMYGVAPPLPEQNRAEHRVFKKLLAQPPKMWATHPPVREREDNAKRTYVPCALDDRSAWELFRDPHGTRNQVTHLMIELILNPPAVPGQPAPAAPAQPKPTVMMALEASLAAVDASFERSFNNPAYRGTYLGRPLTRIARTSGELFDAIAARPYTEQEFPSLDALYPAAMREEIERWKLLFTEHLMLKGLLEGNLKQSDANSHYRGEPLRRHVLPALVKSVEAERDAAANTIAARDRHLRSLHQQLARRVGRGWAEYHESLVRLTHYAEHTSADILDANGHLNNVFAVVTADGHVSASEFQRLLAAAHVAYESLARAYSQKGEVVLSPNVLGKMNHVARKEQVVESWGARLGELQLYQPSNMNFGDWLANSQSWLATVPIDFEALADAAVEELLDVEEMLRGPMLAATSWDAIPAAPPPARYPLHYATMEPGRERPRQLQLGWWDRFQLADGLVPATARAVVAVSMLGGMGYLSQLAITHSVYAYNGLNQRVSITIGTDSRQLDPGQSTKFTIGSEDRIRVRTVTAMGSPIESFDEDVSNGQSTYIYNVASAAMLYHVTVTYGYGAEEANERVRPEFFGNPRWSTDRSAGRFDDVPRRVTLSRGQRSTTRTLLGAARIDADAERLLAYANNNHTRSSLIRAHLRFDTPNSTFRSWVRAAQQHDRSALSALSERIDESPSSAVSIMRVEQDTADASSREAVCARHRQWAAAHPGAAGAYLAARCISDESAKEQAFRDGIAQYPGDPYFSWAAAWSATRKGQWDGALSFVEPALNEPSLRDDASVLGAQLERVRWALSMLDRYSSPPMAMEGAPIERFVDRSNYVRELLESERGTGEQSTGPLYALARGQLNSVLARITDAPRRAAFTQLIGASDGATRAQIAAALQTDLDQHPSTAPWVVALAIRELGQPPETMAAALRPHATSYEALVQWLRGLRALAPGVSVPEPPAECDQAMALAMGTIVLSDRAPMRWRTVANAFYFVGQRPYFSRNGVAPAPADAFGYGGLGVRGSSNGYVFGGARGRSDGTSEETVELQAGEGQRPARARRGGR